MRNTSFFPRLLLLCASSALVFAAGCSKSAKKDDGASQPTEKAEAPPAGDNTATAEAKPDTKPEGGDLEAAIAAEGDKKVTLVGSNGKTQVVELGKKTLAETDTYIVKAELPQDAKAGAGSSFSIHVTPKEGWKINQEFPTKLEVTAPSGVTLSNGTQKAKDAAKFSEKGATFKMDFSCDSAGPKAFSGKFKFAVCTDATCDPKSAELAFNIPVAE